MPINSTLDRAKRALRQAFWSCRGAPPPSTSDGHYIDYAESVEANLIQGVPFAQCREDYVLGKGSELIGRNGQPPKMAAMFSSSALVVNTFGPWRNDPLTLTLKAHQTLQSLKFEASCPNGLQQFSPRATNPHLDVLLQSQDNVLGIESKCLEYLSLKEASFSNTYAKISDERNQSLWFQYIAVLREASHLYRHLDVAQLIKHALGLSYTYAGKQQNPPEILYLFWEPTNWKNFDEFKRHRDEIEQFSTAVRGDSLRFAALSYSELWEDWERRLSPDWLPQHVKNLLERYAVEI
ncbi:MAG: hypothetical protein WCH20_16310 [Nitrospira sp.]